MSLDPLTKALRAHLLPDASAWLDDAVVASRAGLRSAGFAARWNAAGRTLGRQRLKGQHWDVDELGRALLLIEAVRATPEADVPPALSEMFRGGELREQQALVKALGHLPEPRRFRAIAENAVRSNALSVLEAIACENPYPAACLDELHFNQMVMKALFNGLHLSRVSGLAGRLNAELRRMAAAWVSERTAAARPVPKDISLVIGEPHAPV